MKKPINIILVSIGLMAILSFFLNNDEIKAVIEILILFFIALFSILINGFFQIAKSTGDDKNRKYIGLSLISLFLIFFILSAIARY